MRPRDNPFAMARLEQVLAFRPEWLGQSWDTLLARIETTRGTRTVIGRHGAGKTTLFEALATRLAARGHPVVRLFFNDTNRCLAPGTLDLPTNLGNTTVLLDGDRHLPLIVRARLARRLAGARLVLCTRHRRSLLPVFLRLEPDAALLHRCVREVAGRHYPQLAPQLDAWFRSERGNLRHVLRRCYDAMA
ncbi:MAG: hypothetical protein NTW21_32095 [Verrucomicrobia bacterium]|nr:hypothetical protein [Verrucomicrobiota bacterium]